jgi:hypothetical protein
MELPKMNNLNSLLSTPLASISDNGFSQQVVKRINRYYYWRSMVLKSLFVFLVLLFIVLSSPVLLLAQLNQLSAYLTHQLTDISQLNLTQLDLSQLSQQPLLWLVFLTSAIIILSPQSK